MDFPGSSGSTRREHFTIPLVPTPSHPQWMLGNARVQPSHLLRLQYKRQHPVEMYRHQAVRVSVFSVEIYRYQAARVTWVFSGDIQASGGQSHVCFQWRYTGIRRSESHVNTHRTLEISFSEEHTCQEGLFFESRGVAPVSLMH